MSFGLELVIVDLDDQPGYVGPIIACGGLIIFIKRWKREWNCLKGDDVGGSDCGYVATVVIMGSLKMEISAKLSYMGGRINERWLAGI